MRTLILFLLCVIPGWALWDNGYTWRASITIDNTKVSGAGDLTDFPVLISGTYDGTGGEPNLKDFANGGEVQSASGWDIRFETTGGAQLDHEIELYTASTGAVVIWVEVGTVDHDDDTVIYMFWGKGGLGSSEEDVTGTWSSNYKAVWHMAQDPSGGSPQILDSTTNDNDAASNGTMLTEDLVVALAGNGLDLDGGDDFLNVATDATLDLVNNGDWTASIWIYDHALADGDSHLLVMQGDGGGTGRIASVLDLDESLCAGAPTDEYASFVAGVASCSGVTGTQDDWKYVAITVAENGAADSLKIYVDGDLKVTTARDSETNDGAAWLIGAHKLATWYTDGLIDEARLLADDMTADWLLTEFNNQDDPGAFYAVGTPATQGGAHAPIVMD